MDNRGLQSQASTADQASKQRGDAGQVGDKSRRHRDFMGLPIRAKPAQTKGRASQIKVLARTRGAAVAGNDPFAGAKQDKTFGQTCIRDRGVCDGVWVLRVIGAIKAFHGRSFAFWECGPVYRVSSVRRVNGPRADCPLPAPRHGITPVLC